MNKNYSNFPLDANNPGWVKGWGVFRGAPWHLAGLFLTEEEADVCRKTLDEHYQIAYGSHRLGSDDFAYTAVMAP